MRPRALVCMAMLVSLAACGTAELKPVTTPDPQILPQETPTPGPQQAGDTSGQAVTGAIKVLASSRFENYLYEIRRSFVGQFSDASVEFVFAPTAELRDRIGRGEPGDVFVADDEAAMATVVEADRMSDRAKTFARAEGRTFQVAVLKPAGNLPTSQRFVGVITGRFGQEAARRHGMEPAAA
ncbi:MAG TPA: substrate-binding domain-containing protein [Actinomycetota bacterium]|nr:substrate-binding domain-containing protein [Actinomycetota bacterium]